MKYTQINKFIKDNNLLNGVEEKPGIYAITIDDKVAYVGQSVDTLQRCKTHIYNTENAMLIKEKKYLLLLSAKLGGHNIDCRVLEYCEPNKLDELEAEYIEKYNPCLNILTPHGKNDIKNLKIEEVLNTLAASN